MVTDPPCRSAKNLVTADVHERENRLRRKDSALALRRIRRDERYEAVSLLTACHEHFQRVSMHGTRYACGDLSACHITRWPTSISRLDARGFQKSIGIFRGPCDTALTVQRCPFCHYPLEGSGPGSEASKVNLVYIERPKPSTVSH